MRTSRTLTITHTLLTSLALSAQPAIEWQKCLGGTSNESAQSVQQTSDGGFIVAGWTTSNNVDVSGNQGGSDIWVVKLYADASIQWQRSLGGSGEDGLGYIADGHVSIQQTSNGGYVMAGYTESNDGDVSGYHGNRDAWVVKLSTSGVVEWQRCLGGSLEDQANGIQQTSDGGFIVVGYTESTDGDVTGHHDDEDVWLVKLDASGNLLWQKCLGGSSADFGYSVDQTLDGGYIIVGNTWSNDGDVIGNHGGPFGLFQDAWAVKVDDTGSIQWQRCFGGTDFDFFYAVEQTTDGGYIIAGETASNDGDVSGLHGSGDAWVVRLDATGETEWQKCLGGSLAEEALDIKPVTGEGYVLVCPTTSNNYQVSANHGGTDIWLVRLNTIGDIVWERCLGGSYGDNGYHVSLADDGGYVVVGETWSNDGDVSGSHGDGSGNISDAWIAKLAPDEVGIGEPAHASFTLAPNPARSMVSIALTGNPAPQEVMLLDATGRTVMTQPTATSTASLSLDLAGQESGMYLVQLRFADGTRAVERVVKE